MDQQFSEDFIYYADIVFEHLGPLVKHWLTFNEPMSICHLGYGIGIFAPGVEGGTQGHYKCGHTLLLSHAKAVQLYRGKYQATQGGRISMAISGHWGLPVNPNKLVDVEAANTYVEYQIAWMADPLYFGDYPKSMRMAQPDLPKFSKEQKSLLAGSLDFFALNFYTSHFIKAPPEGVAPSQVGSTAGDLGAVDNTLRLPPTKPSCHLNDSCFLGCCNYKAHTSCGLALIQCSSITLTAPLVYIASNVHWLIVLSFSVQILLASS